MVKAIFPKTELELFPVEMQDEIWYKVKCSTLLRLKGDDGIWYLIPHLKDMWVETPEYAHQCLSLLLEEVYLSMHFYKLPSTFVTFDGKPLVEADSNQQIEEDRLRECYLNV